jgi:hypothetical protein
MPKRYVNRLFDLFSGEQQPPCAGGDLVELV